MRNVRRLLEKRLVALRKESVDRNSTVVLSGSLISLSLSARRAWIEIVYSAEKVGLPMVALRKESVDRNAAATLTPTVIIRRSPQGERG